MVGSKTSLMRCTPIMGDGFYAYSTRIGQIIVEIVTDEKIIKPIKKALIHLAIPAPCGCQSADNSKKP